MLLCLIFKGKEAKVKQVTFTDLAHDCGKKSQKEHAETADVQGSPVPVTYAG